jgi:hypothetical protein
MPRYVVERTYGDGLAVTLDEAGARACLEAIDRNANHGVTWLHSYVTEDRRRSYCVYDGPSPEAIRWAATLNGLPVDVISEVRVLDPYFYL